MLDTSVEGERNTILRNYRITCHMAFFPNYHVMVAVYPEKFGFLAPIHSLILDQKYCNGKPGPTESMKVLLLTSTGGQFQP